MYKVIVDCVDMENAYDIQDQEGLEYLRQYVEDKNIQAFEENFKKYIKKQQDKIYQDNLLNLLKHLKSANMFKWDCNFYIKKIGG